MGLARDMLHERSDHPQAKRGVAFGGQGETSPLSARALSGVSHTRQHACAGAPCGVGH